MSIPTGHLLAVDVGLHTGLALFNDQADLLWYRSHHIATPGKLKKIIAKLLREPPRPTHLFLEGGGPLAELWQFEATKCPLAVRQLPAEQWRRKFFYDRQMRSGPLAKREALVLARQVIEQLGQKKATSLRHDTAEAILVGVFGLLELGWLDNWPPTNPRGENDGRI